MIYNIRKIMYLSSLCIVLITYHNGYAQKLRNKRPRVGIVLSGGGARGIAHIGVIKVLEKYGIHADYIVGTSMGSLVGGLYASGYNANTLEKIARSIDWDDYLNDTLNRRELPLDEKKDEGRFVISLPRRGSTLSPIAGIIEGVKLHTFLNRLTFHVHSITDFNKLSIPFACIATDIHSGKTVILKKGNLASAMRASMSIPSIFTPVEIDGHLLVDGGLVLNLPASVAKKMGADIIIGVDVSTPLYSKKDTLSIPKIIDQISSFRAAESTRKQRALCDVIITPKLTGLSSTDFYKTDALITQGEKAALEHARELEKISMRQHKYKIIPRETIAYNDKNSKIYINTLEVKGLAHISKKQLYNWLQLKIPSLICVRDIEKAIFRIYGSKLFRTVTYRIENKNGLKVLVVTVKETATDFLNIGIRYGSDLKAAMLVNTEFKNILGEGSRSDVEARFGENPAFKAGYITGFGWPVGFGFGSEIWYERINVFSYYNNSLSGEYKFRSYGGNIFTYLVLYHNLAISLGLKKEFIRIDDVLSMEDFSSQTLDYLNPYIAFTLDTIDRAAFTHSGVYIQGEAMHVSDRFSIYDTEKASAQRYNSHIKIYIPLHPRITFLLSHFLGVIRGENIPSVYYFFLGGMHTHRNMIFPFLGLDYMEVSGINIHSGSTGLQFEIYKNWFLKLMGNIAKVEESTEDVISYQDNQDKILYGYGISFGYLSFLGPLEWTISRGKNNNLHHAINIGFVF